MKQEMIDLLKGLKKQNFVAVDGQTSSKFDPDREEKVQNGLAELQKLNTGLPENIFLLAKFWEHKSYRGQIKDALWIEAVEVAGKTAGNEWRFVVEDIRGQIQALENISQAINRLLYVSNFYKPRDTMKKFSHAGKIYTVPEKEFNLLAEKHKNNKKALLEAALKIATVEVFEEL